jgi:hypothetical protein
MRGLRDLEEDAARRVLRTLGVPSGEIEEFCAAQRASHYQRQPPRPTLPEGTCVFTALPFLLEDVEAVEFSREPRWFAEEAIAAARQISEELGYPDLAYTIARSVWLGLRMSSDTAKRALAGQAALILASIARMWQDFPEALKWLDRADALISDSDPYLRFEVTNTRLLVLLYRDRSNPNEAVNLLTDHRTFAETHWIDSLVPDWRGVSGVKVHGILYRDGAQALIPLAAVDGSRHQQLSEWLDRLSTVTDKEEEPNTKWLNSFVLVRGRSLVGDVKNATAAYGQMQTLLPNPQRTFAAKEQRAFGALMLATGDQEKAGIAFKTATRYYRDCGNLTQARHLAGLIKGLENGQPIQDLAT